MKGEGWRFLQFSASFQCEAISGARQNGNCSVVRLQMFLPSKVLVLTYKNHVPGR